MKTNKCFKVEGLSGRDTISEVGIQMENEAVGKQEQEQGVFSGPDKDEYMARGRGEKDE